MNKKRITLQEPEYSQEILSKHKRTEVRHKAQVSKLAKARKAQLAVLKASSDPVSEVAAVKLENIINEAEYEASIPLPIKLTDQQKMQHDSDWKTYRERQARLEKQRGQAFLMI
jgi:hypothetical protein